MDKYDSTEDTKKHIEAVQSLALDMVLNIMRRIGQHDASKLASPEKEIFDTVRPNLKKMAYNSPEYKAALKEALPAIKHHYGANSHHPEHYKAWRCPVCKLVFRDEEAPISGVFVGEIRLCPNCCKYGTIMECTLEPASGIHGMSLLDLIEMLADWKVASSEQFGGSIENSIKENKKRFEMSDQLVMIFENTVREMDW